MEHIEMNRMDYPGAGQPTNVGPDVNTHGMDNSPAHAYLDGQPCCCPVCFSFDM